MCTLSTICLAFTRPSSPAHAIHPFPRSFTYAFGISWGPLGWLLPVETQPLETRSAAQGLSVAVNFLSVFVTTQSFLTMLCRHEIAWVAGVLPCCHGDGIKGPPKEGIWHGPSHLQLSLHPHPTAEPPPPPTPVLQDGVGCFCVLRCSGCVHAAFRVGAFQRDAWGAPGRGARCVGKTLVLGALGWRGQG
jgi:hypothetical protein